MNHKFYVSLKAARLLKEKGYNEVCDCVIDDDGDIFEDEYQINQDLPEWKWSCPTKAEAINWLENKGIMIEIALDIDECAWIFNIVDKEKFITIYHPKDREFFTDRLETEEAAIIKALKYLIM